jgi:uncharacterized protein YdaU (DUF1376 family)
MKGEYYRMDYEAWNEGTYDLTLEQEAAYLRLCHQMYRRGGPIPNSKHLLCSLFRSGHTRATALLNKLIKAGKIVVTENGELANKRVLRELTEREELLAKKRAAGHYGGLKNKRVATPADPDQTPSRPRADPDQVPSNLRATAAKSLNGHDPPEASAKLGEERRREESTSSLRSEAPVSPDARTLLFRNGLSDLVAMSGRPETKLRAVLGKWLRDADDDALRILTLIAKAKQDQPADPIAWIEGHFRRETEPPRRDQYGRAVRQRN